LIIILSCSSIALKVKNQLVILAIGYLKNKVSASIIFEKNYEQLNKTYL